MSRVEEIDNEIQKLYDRVHELDKEKREIELGNLDEFENKYLLIHDAFGWEVYTKPYSVFVSGRDIIIRGIGFSWEISHYWDATSMHWSWGDDTRIPQSEWKEYKENFIKEITEQEYHDAFNKMLNDIKAKHIEICKNNV